MSRDPLESIIFLVFFESYVNRTKNHVRLKHKNQVIGLILYLGLLTIFFLQCSPLIWSISLVM